MSPAHSIRLPSTFRCATAPPASGALALSDASQALECAGWSTWSLDAEGPCRRGHSLKDRTPTWRPAQEADSTARPRGEFIKRHTTRRGGAGCSSLPCPQCSWVYVRARVRVRVRCVGCSCEWLPLSPCCPCLRMCLWFCHGACAPSSLHRLLCVCQWRSATVGILRLVVLGAGPFKLTWGARWPGPGLASRLGLPAGARARLVTTRVLLVGLGGYELAAVTEGAQLGCEDPRSCY